jgi:hypothetical protein
MDVPKRLGDDDPIDPRRPLDPHHDRFGSTVAAAATRHRSG